MEQRPLLEPQWRRVLYSLLPLCMAGTISILMIWVGIVFIRDFIHGDVDRLTFFVMLGGLPFYALPFLITFIILHDCFTSVFFSADGIECRVFGKRRCFIPWDELAEVGIGVDSWKGGPSFTLYFSDRQLEDTERVDLPISLQDEKNTRLIRAGEIDFQKLEELKAFCPLTVPPIPSRKEKKCTLVSYQRSRLPDGTWGEPHFYGIPDARETLIRLREKQRRRK